MDVFCKIVNGDIPCYKVYEDEVCLAFLDVNPVSKGHTIVVPKQHFEEALDCDMEVYLHIMKVVKTLATTWVNKLDAKGCNIVTNAKEVAGQTVPHFHVHIIPRYSDEDGYRAEYVKQEGLDLVEIMHVLTVE
ncbi:MAG: HIT family protein [Erysipelotrichaceae bacterium]|nr:HIT family protein [Erysipelotrichaceae bacterium]MBQ9987884.1 HIT family protein [Erysipelotrichales bacterium]MBR3693003.1 HIT family protein [Erysipelotrichales bacterium]